MIKLSYQDKVKMSKKNLEVLNSMLDGEKLKVTFNTIKKYKGGLEEYTINCWVRDVTRKGEVVKEKSFSIHRSYQGMNLELSRTTLRGYTFDMMIQKTTYNFPLWEMNIVGDIIPPAKETDKEEEE